MAKRNETAYTVELIPVQRIEQQTEIYQGAVAHWISDAIPRGNASCFCCSHKWKALEPPLPLAFLFIKDVGGPSNEVFVSGICSACCTHPDRDARLDAAVRRNLGKHVREVPWPAEVSKKAQ